MSNPEAVSDFISSLSDLKTTNKANISMLTILADDDKRYAPEITKVIENRLREAPPTEKLPVLYLIDSIVKNLPDTPYRELFAENIVNNFVNVFSQVDEKVRASMYKVRQTWCEIFSAKKLFVLDVKVNKVDPKWPIMPLPSDDVTSAKAPVKVAPHPVSSATADSSHTVTPGGASTFPASAVTNESILAKEEELRRLRETHLELQLQKQRMIIEKQKEELARIEQTRELQQRITMLVEQVKTTPLPDSAQKLLLETISSTLVAVQDPQSFPSNSSTAAATSTAAPPRDPRKRHPPEQPAAVSKGDEVFGQLVQNLKEAERFLKPVATEDEELAGNGRSKQTDSTDSSSPGSNKRLSKRHLEPRDTSLPAVKTAKSDSDGVTHMSVDEKSAQSSMEVAETRKTAKEDDGFSDVEFNAALNDFKQMSTEQASFLHVRDERLPKKSALKAGTLPPPPFTASQPQPLEPVQPLKPPCSATSLPPGPGPMPSLPSTMSSESGRAMSTRQASSGMSNHEQVRLLDEAERQLHSGQLTTAQHGALVDRLTQLYDIQRKIIDVRGPHQATQTTVASTTTTASLPPVLMAPSTATGSTGKLMVSGAPDLPAHPIAQSEPVKPSMPLLPVPSVIPPPGGIPPMPPTQTPFPPLPHPVIQSTEHVQPRQQQPPLLPTPPVSEKGTPMIQPASFPSTAHVVLNGEPIDMTIGGPPRTVCVAGKRRVVRINAQSRQILMDGRPVYKLNSTLREIVVDGCRCMIFYHGEMQSIWINSVEYRVRVDAPPQTVTVEGNPIELVIDTGAGDILVNGERACAIANLPCDVALPPNGNRYRFSFHAPARQIQIDNQLCEVKLDLPVPAVLINGELRGIRFDGPPRVLLVDDDPFEIHTDRSIPIKFGRDDNSTLDVQLGAPAQELIIGEHRYNIGFGTGPVFLMLNGRKVKVELPGHTPEVKLLGLFDPVTGQLLTPTVPPPPMPPMPLPPLPFGNVPFGPPPMPLPPIPPGAPPFDFRLFPPSQMAVEQAQHSGSYAQPSPPIEHIQIPVTVPAPPPLPLPPSLPPPNIVPPMSLPMPPVTVPPPPILPSLPAGLDINDLINRLAKKGMLPLPSLPGAAVGQKSDDKAKLPIRDTPDLTDFNMEIFKTKYQAEVTRLYAGVQCGSCGCRFSSPESSRYRLHLDWHFRVNKREREAVRVLRHRAWFLPVLDWIGLEQSADPDQSLGVNESSMMVNVTEGGGSGGNQRFAEVPVASEASHQTNDTVVSAEGRPTQLSIIDGGLQKLPSDGEERSNGTSVVSCPAASDTKKDTCVVCGEGFETFWNEELDEWHLKDAVCVSGKTYHTVCFEDAARTVGSTPSSPTFPPSTPIVESSTAAKIAVESADDDSNSKTNMVPICSTPPPVPPGALVCPEYPQPEDTVKLEPILKMEATTGDDAS